MMRREKFTIANIYVPVKHRATLKPDRPRDHAEYAAGSRTASTHPEFRRNGDRFKSSYTGCIASKRARFGLGEETISGYLAQAPKTPGAQVFVQKAPRP